MDWSPHITVASILEREHQFLFVEERINDALVLNQPAGHWEQGETLLDASIRETLEETAWHYQPSHITGIYQWLHPETKETFLRFCFTGELEKHETHRELDEVIEQAVWLSYEQLMARHKQHRSPLVQQCIDDYLKGQRFDLSLLQTG